MKVPSLIIVCHTVLINSTVIINSPSNLPRFNCVYSFKNLTSFYESLRHKNLPTDSDTPDLPTIKKTICERITNSQFFRHDEYEFIDPEEELWFRTLKTNKHKTTFRELFRNDNLTNKDVLQNPTVIVTVKYVYENAYAEKKIRFNEVNMLTAEPTEDRPPTFGLKDNLDVGKLGRQAVVDVEHVFLCLTRQANSTKDFQKWYVSKEYNVRPTRVIPVPGRFVFKLSESESEFELVALAEESAEEFYPPYSLEQYYYQTIRKNHKQALKAEYDPLCKLITDGDEHHRLCSAVMYSEYFTEVTEKTVTQELDEHRCTRQEVVSQMADNYTHQNTKFYEWMVPCKVLSKLTKNEVFYYISRAYQDNAVLVYTTSYQTLGKMSLLKMFNNVYITDNGKDDEFPKTRSSRSRLGTKRIRSAEKKTKKVAWSDSLTRP